jgi:hypothetical protein
MWFLMKNNNNLQNPRSLILGINVFLTALYVYVICIGLYMYSLDKNELAEWQMSFFMISAVYLIFSYILVGACFSLACLFDVIKSAVQKVSNELLFEKILFQLIVTVAICCYIFICLFLTITTFRFGLSITYLYLAIFTLFYVIFNKMKKINIFTSFILNSIILIGCFFGMSVMMIMSTNVYKAISNITGAFL